MEIIKTPEKPAELIASMETIKTLEKPEELMVQLCSIAQRLIDDPASQEDKNAMEQFKNPT